MTIMKNKKIVIEDFYRKGLVIPGSQYIPKSWLPKKVPSLNQIRRRLAKIKGPLAETVAQIREEE